MKKLVFLNLFLSFILSAFCQYPETHFERISDQQGLYDHWIKCILQDRKGFLWIGGENGLYRYDGYTIMNYKDPPGCKNCSHFYPVYGIREDSHGMLWTISFNGITLYDPETEQSCLVYPFRSASASSGSSFFFSRKLDLITDIHENIWATDNVGLIRFSYRKKDYNKELVFDKGPESTFRTDSFQLSQDRNSLENMVVKLYEDSEQNIWAGSQDGLYVLRSGDSTFYRFEIETEIKATSRTYINDIIQQNKDTFWIISGNSNYLMTNVKKALSGVVPDISELYFKKFNLKDNQANTSFIADGRPFYKDRKNNIVIGTSKGVFIFKGKDEKKSLAFESLLKPIPEDENSISDGIDNIFEDRSGIFWIGYQQTGILKINPDRTRFQANPDFKKCNITILQHDGEGNLWLGSYADGLFRIGKKSGLVTKYDLGMYGNQIVCLHEMQPGIFWIGTSNIGLIEFNSLNGRSRNPFTKGKIAERLRQTQVNNILKDKNLVYLTTASGIVAYDLIKEKLTSFSFPDSSSAYLDNWTISPLKLKNGEIIVFTSLYGINKINYDPEKGMLKPTCIIPDSTLRKNNINLAHICSLYQDSHGSIWMAEKSGLHRLDLEKAYIYNYRLFQNIDFPEAWSIQEDEHDNLWIGTHFGLCRFNTISGLVKVFTEKDGVPLTWHQYNSVLRDHNGRISFGGTGGYYSFHPDSIKTNNYIPPVVITDFRLFNKSVGVDNSRKAILTRSISYTSKIELDHDQNDISFEFAALDYNLPLKNQYAYKLEGYQDNWIETGAQNRLATYTNLSPGTYIFHVKGSNNDGLWNEEGTSLTIIIDKPWWSTAIAWIIYVLVFLGAVGGYVRWRLWRMKKEKIDLEHQIRERTKQVEEQRDLLEKQNQLITEQEQLKSRFFTNISHEFRTPLSLIQSPVEELLDTPGRNENDSRKLNMVKRNAHRLLKLVNQLLDISKIDGSKMKLELVHDDVIKYLRAVAGAFTSLAETKKINYVRKFPSEEHLSWFDPDKLEKIAGNLLSNAFKFTPEGGTVIFTAGYRDTNYNLANFGLEFSIKDNGPGIPPGSLEKIFDRFYQVGESIKTEGGGTGIGLSLARDMARLMYGDITVKSEPGNGSTFSVVLPLNTDHLKESEFILLNKTPETVDFKHEYNVGPEDFFLKKEKITGNSKPVILIVEDNRDIRIQLSDNLCHEYTIQEAIDGVAGLKKATEIIPDLIITDLMMPRMDGVELCDKLKNDVRTSHIPVIMLTAKVSMEDKITGLLTGADDYVPKPFHMVELKARMTNLIEQRRKLRERFSREITLKPRDISVTPLDEKFLNRAVEVVEVHMRDDVFDIRMFREEMNMSGSTLFRKLHALTNQSPSEFIRTIRLKRSASLLEQNWGNVTQVSYEVGFNNLSYFNKSFKKLFGMSPVKYLKTHQAKKAEID
jgi:signal transduction histidine kinase/DNA-binding response OmpR family regulator/ligand-binding sensor domain-containing protein